MICNAFDMLETFDVHFSSIYQFVFASGNLAMSCTFFWNNIEDRRRKGDVPTAQNDRDNRFGGESDHAARDKEATSAIQLELLSSVFGVCLWSRHVAWHSMISYYYYIVTDLSMALAKYEINPTEHYCCYTSVWLLQTNTDVSHE